MTTCRRPAIASHDTVAAHGVQNILNEESLTFLSSIVLLYYFSLSPRKVLGSLEWAGTGLSPSARAPGRRDASSIGQNRSPLHLPYRIYPTQQPPLPGQINEQATLSDPDPVSAK